MKLKELLTAIPLYYGNPDLEIDITHIAQDSRSVKKGSLFICIDGEVVNGHQFARKAVENGASIIIAEKDLAVSVPVIKVRDTKRAMAMLADKFFGQPSKKIRMVGITGTNGKTSVSHLVDHILQRNGEKTGLIGTMYCKMGDEIQETKNTTPDSLTLQQTLAKMIDFGITTTVMEVSSHALIQGRVYGTEYDIAVFTNLSQDHLDYHHSMEEYAHAKSLLFAQLGNHYLTQKTKTAILNSDDNVSTIMKKATAAHIITYGIENKADFQAKDIQITSTGTDFKILTPDGEKQLHVKMIGKFSIYNLLAALATSYAAGIPLDAALASLSEIEGIAGRFELVHAGQDFTVIVDYAHTPDGLLNVLQTVAEFAKNRIFVVVGCGGDRDKTKRPKMARIAVEYASLSIFTSDNPRTEDPQTIIQDMIAGVEGENYLIRKNRKEAIECAVKQAKPGDVVLIAGKGHEDYQIIGTKKFDFDDRVVAKEAIEKTVNFK